MKTFRAELAFPGRAMLGEGSLWDAERQQLCWVDIYDCKVCLFDPARGCNSAFDVGANVGTVVPTREGELLIALRDEIACLDPETGKLRRVATAHPPTPGLRFNDGKCDPEGRFWIGSMVEEGPQGGAALYMLDHDLRVKQQLAGLTISNGLAWSGDSFYHIDTPTMELRGYRYQAGSGDLSEPHVVTSFAEGNGAPDGMCLDADGMLWVALWGGRGVVRVDPTSGETVCRVEVPAENVTSCAFGGPELDILYITTAQVGLSADALKADPLSGSLFCVRLPFRGLPSPAFGGTLPR